MIFTNASYEKICFGGDLRLLQKLAADYADLRRLILQKFATDYADGAD